MFDLIFSYGIIFTSLKSVLCYVAFSPLAITHDHELQVIVSYEVVLLWICMIRLKAERNSMTVAQCVILFTGESRVLAYVPQFMPNSSENQCNITENITHVNMILIHHDLPNIIRETELSNVT